MDVKFHRNLNNPQNKKKAHENFMCLKKIN